MWLLPTVMRKSVLGSMAALEDPGALGNLAVPSQEEVSTNYALFLSPLFLPIPFSRALRLGPVSSFRWWGGPL